MRILLVVVMLVMTLAFPVRAQQLHLTEVDIGPVLCDNWVSFPYVWFTNHTAQTIRVRAIRAKLASAQSLQGEFGIWVARNGDPNYRTGELLYSYGASGFTPPSQALQDTMIFPGYFEMAPGESWYVVANCGPVTGGPPGFYYVAAVQFWWEK
jgi:hypothetical protein